MNQLESPHTLVGVGINHSSSIQRIEEIYNNGDDF